MLEATLMNKSAQKRCEWEPVLRHAINLKAENEDKQVTTLFIADELDTNTINIWRAVASVPLQASKNKAETNKVYIMPFTNSDMVHFLKHNITGNNILKIVRNSFDELNQEFDTGWRGEILNELVN